MNLRDTIQDVQQKLRDQLEGAAQVQALTRELQERHAHEHELRQAQHEHELKEMRAHFLRLREQDAERHQVALATLEITVQRHLEVLAAAAQEEAESRVIAQVKPHLGEILEVLAALRITPMQVLKFLVEHGDFEEAAEAAEAAEERGETPTPRATPKGFPEGFSNAFEDLFGNMAFVRGAGRKAPPEGTPSP